MEDIIHTAAKKYLILRVSNAVGKGGYMAAFFRQVKIGVLTLTLEKKQ